MCVKTRQYRDTPVEAVHCPCYKYHYTKLRFTEYSGEFTEYLGEYKLLHSYPFMDTFDLSWG